ncbi:hypothetical protein BRADO6406 [Bradyrhizobium sp. ORS 278]|uniref:hypothetical protein n=1 Tax=Bradyrhizobium sp. (strain ORS 278) TaxID=114615 RepID=UPI00015084F2|nr:hypothetical protein [Bradyrhizobium sp. ORS 278]CAL80033.1 hypothetical protein BRADO6406 [Bradyrhizobium sp. ORS 278]
MSSKSDAARNAVAAAAANGFLRPKPAQPVEGRSGNVVEIKPEAAPVDIETTPKERGKPAKASEGKVRTTYKRSMLYLPPKAKKKFKEIAFISDRKEHDIYLEALREYLEKLGHPGLL